MEAIGKFGLAVVAGAAMLALTAGAAAAAPAIGHAEMPALVVPAHGCHLGCVKTAPRSYHRHNRSNCARIECGRMPSPQPPRR